MNKQELVNILTKQHQDLKESLELAKKACEDKNFSEILKNLNEFEQLLISHLDLENTVFYPDYKSTKISLGQSAEDIQKFIDEMVVIGEKVFSFLTKYKTEESINKDCELFKQELLNIISTLNVRVSIEEEDLYKLYLLV